MYKKDDWRNLIRTVTFRKPIHFDKLRYHCSNIFNLLAFLTPLKSRYKKKCLSLLSDREIYRQVLDRINYYNKKNKNFPLIEQVISNDAWDIIPSKNGHQTLITRRNKVFFADIQRAYWYDFLAILLFFPRKTVTAYTMGDVTFIPSVPSVVKSRPIQADNSNSVLLKLNSTRHFNFIDDPYLFKNKKSLLVWRGNAVQQHRKDFLRQHFSNILCDVAQVSSPSEYAYADCLTIQQQLAFKFILCIEGNDVATNLKWVMSSNSICVMPKPKYETWFMEGVLQPGVHYIEIADDYSDLDDKIRYYTEHADEALKIIKNAHQHVALFKNKEIEDLISILVMEKYYRLSGQLNTDY